MMLSTPGKYAELLTLMPNALAGLPHPAGGSLMENLEIGPLGFAQGGASKHHAEFFLLFSGAQVSGGSVLTNYRTLNPINRSMVSQARRQFAQLNFDLEFFDRLAGVM